MGEKDEAKSDCHIQFKPGLPLTPTNPAHHFQLDNFVCRDKRKRIWEGDNNITLGTLCAVQRNESDDPSYLSSLSNCFPLGLSLLLSFENRVKVKEGKLQSFASLSRIPADSPLLRLS